MDTDAHRREAELEPRDVAREIVALCDEIDRGRDENKRLRIALDLIESMTTAPMTRTHDEWCRDIESVLWAIRDIREPAR